MKKLLTLTVALAISCTLYAQVGVINADSIRLGNPAGTGGMALFGKTYLKNITPGSPHDSILVRNANGSIRMVPRSVLFAAFATAADLSSYQTLANLSSDLSPSATKYPSVNAVNAGIAAAVAAIDLSDYLPLAGGTLTGGLTGTTITANSFTGAGTGLTGTASGLSIGGNAATATAWGGSTANFSVNQAPANSAGVASFNTTSGQWEYLSKANLQSALGITGGPFLPTAGGTILAGGNIQFTSGDIQYLSNDGFGLLSADGNRQLSVVNSGIGIANALTVGGTIVANEPDANLRLIGGNTDATDGFVGASPTGVLYFRNWAGTRGFTIDASNVLAHTGSITAANISSTNNANNIVQRDGAGNFAAGAITASSFIKSGGTSSQFLKADGSVDNNTYLTPSGAWTTNTSQTGLTGDKSTTGTIEIEKTGIGTTVTPGMILTNKTTTGNQYSPSLIFKGRSLVGGVGQEQRQGRVTLKSGVLSFEISSDAGSTWTGMLNLSSSALNIGDATQASLSVLSLTASRSFSFPDFTGTLAGWATTPVNGSLTKWNGTTGELTNAVAGTDYVVPAALSNYVNTTGNQSGIAGNKTWTGDHLWQIGAGPSIEISQSAGQIISTNGTNVTTTSPGSIIINSTGVAGIALAPDAIDGNALYATNNSSSRATIVGINYNSGSLMTLSNSGGIRFTVGNGGAITTSTLTNGAVYSSSGTLTNTVPTSGAIGYLTRNSGTGDLSPSTANDRLTVISNNAAYSIYGNNTASLGVGVNGQSNSGVGVFGSTSTYRAVMGDAVGTNGIALYGSAISGQAALLRNNSNTNPALDVTNQNASGKILSLKNNVGEVVSVSNNGSISTDGNVSAAKYNLSALNTAPSSASDTGTTGEIRVTSTYIYVCTATNTWVRAALATW